MNCQLGSGIAATEKPYTPISLPTVRPSMMPSGTGWKRSLIPMPLSGIPALAKAKIGRTR